MISAIISGSLVTDPRSGTSKTGTEWSNAVVRVPCGTNREGEAEAAFVQVAAFGSEAAKLSRLGKGDSVSAAGALKPSEYQAKDGATRHGLSLTATGILTAYQVKKKRGDSADPGQTRQQPKGDGRNVSTYYQAVRDDYNDDIGF